MSKFSEHLETGIIYSGMTENQLAKISGFTRSYIALMKNGQRVSPDTEKMTKLMKALNLPPYEYEELWKEYIRAKMGDYVSDRNDAVIDFIHSFNNVSDLSLKSFYYNVIPEIKTINSHLDMEYLIKAVIQNESMKEYGYVHIIAQGEENVLTQILPGVCKNNKELEIEHIVCMQKYTQTGKENDQLYNVRMLKNLIPIPVFSNSVSYRVFYYYDNVTSRFHSGTLLSYMILTSEYLICMDSDMSRGMFSKEPEVHQLYEQMFQEHKKNCRQMISYMEGMEEILSWHLKRDNSENITYSIAQQPCFGVLNVSGLINKYCQASDKELLAFLESLIRKNGQRISGENNKHISYCSKEGLDRFAKEGIVDELPLEQCQKVSVEDRRRVLRMLLDAMDKESYELYLLEKNAFSFPKELCINAYGIEEVLIVYLSEQVQSRFILEENSLTRILYESLQNLMKTPQVGSRQAARVYVEKILGELDQ